MQELLDGDKTEFARPAHACPRRMLMIGRGGSYDSATFLLDQPIYSVGRDTANSLVLEDPSISRRHAHLEIDEGTQQVKVVDLRSFNGTFVNGKKVKRIEARPGDILRFGGLAFKVDLESRSREVPTKSPALQSRRLQMIVGAIVALLLAIALVVVLKSFSGQRSDQPTPEDILASRGAEISALAKEASAKVAARKWKEALQTVALLLQQDPLHREARRLKILALDEIKNRELLDQALGTFALGTQSSLLDARTSFSSIPRNSVYHAEAQDNLYEIDSRIAQGYRIQGVSRYRARYFRLAYELLCKFFETMPETAIISGERRLRDIMSKIEKKYSKARHKKIARCKANRYLKMNVAGKVKEEVDDLIKGKYGQRDIRAIVTLYADGKLRSAIKRAEMEEKKPSMRPHLSVIEMISSRLATIRSHYEKGHELIKSRDLKGADRSFSVVLDNDRFLLPPTVTSIYRKEIVKMLLESYLELGKADFREERYVAAFASWKRAKEISGGSPESRAAIAKLENVAKNLLEEARKDVEKNNPAPARSKLNVAKRILEIGNPIRADVQQQISALGGVAP